MKSNKIIGILIMAGAGFWLYTSYQQRLAREQQLRELQQRYANSIPDSQTPDWYRYIALIISLYGTVSSLWAPGGIFYKSAVPNPQTDPVGWSKILAQLKLNP